jgi:hypothetical protein
MKQHEGKFAPDVLPSSTAASARGNFIRRGLVGAWSEHITKEQEAVFDLVRSSYPPTISS